MINKIFLKFVEICTFLFYRPFFYKIGHKTKLIYPMSIDYPKSISVGNNCYISNGAWLLGKDDSKTPTLVIDDNVSIGHFSHIVAKYSVKIGKNVLIADKVFITDCKHEYVDINCPIKNQPVSFLGNVEIGDDSWIGENVSILGAKIGKHCVIGSNAVVTNDISDYTVAVGLPARIIKKYDFNLNKWVDALEG